MLLVIAKQNSSSAQQ